MQPNAVNLDAAPGPTPATEPRTHLRVVERGPGVPSAVPVRIAEEPDAPGWYDEENRFAAERHLERLEAALAAGRRRRAERERGRFLDVVHRDRVEHLYAIARRQWLPLERVGTGPLFREPGLHRDVNRTWRIFPIGAGSGAVLPGPAARAKLAWDAHGRLFDGHYRAYEISDGADVLNGDVSPCLIGAISSDGVSADWFVLDRWTI